MWLFAVPPSLCGKACRVLPVLCFSLIKDTPSHHKTCSLTRKYFWKPFQSWRKQFLPSVQTSTSNVTLTSDLRWVNMIIDNKLLKWFIQYFMINVRCVLQKVFHRNFIYFPIFFKSLPLEAAAFKTDLFFPFSLRHNYKYRVWNQLYDSFLAVCQTDI